MSTVTVSDKGQVVIPAAIRHRLGTAPGTKLDFELEGDTIRVRPLRTVQRTRPEDGYGMLKCDQPGERRLADFDVATAMRGSGERRNGDRGNGDGQRRKRRRKRGPAETGTGNGDGHWGIP
jgi:AbrB family looped-hinge helix DNA binding protein